MLLLHLEDFFGVVHGPRQLILALDWHATPKHMIKLGARMLALVKSLRVLLGIVREVGAGRHGSLLALFRALHLLLLLSTPCL